MYLCASENGRWVNEESHVIIIIIIMTTTITIAMFIKYFGST